MEVAGTSKHGVGLELYLNSSSMGSLQRAQPSSRYHKDMKTNQLWTHSLGSSRFTKHPNKLMDMPLLPQSAQPIPGSLLFYQTLSRLQKQTMYCPCQVLSKGTIHSTAHLNRRSQKRARGSAWMLRVLRVNHFYHGGLPQPVHPMPVHLGWATYWPFELTSGVRYMRRMHSW